MHRVAIVGDDIYKQLFAGRNGIGQPVTINGIAYTVVGKIRHKDQDSNYSGPDNDKVFVPFAAMAKDFPKPDAEPGAVSNIIIAPHQWVIDGLPRQLHERTGAIRDIDWALRSDVRVTLARHKGFDPDDREAIWMWDTSVNSLMFGRMVDTMRDFFTTVGLHHPRPRRHRRDEHHADRGEGADARDRRPQGARRDDRRRAPPVLPRRLLHHADQRHDWHGRGAGDLRRHQPAADAQPLQGHDPLARSRGPDGRSRSSSSASSRRFTRRGGRPRCRRSTRSATRCNGRCPIPPPTRSFRILAVIRTPHRFRGFQVFVEVCREAVSRPFAQPVPRRPGDARHLVGHRVGRHAAGVRKRVSRRAGGRLRQRVRQRRRDRMAWPDQHAGRRRARRTPGAREGGRRAAARRVAAGEGGEPGDRPGAAGQLRHQTGVVSHSRRGACLRADAHRDSPAWRPFPRRRGCPSAPASGVHRRRGQSQAVRPEQRRRPDHSCPRHHVRGDRGDEGEGAALQLLPLGHPVRVHPLHRAAAALVSGLDRRDRVAGRRSVAGAEGREAGVGAPGEAGELQSGRRARAAQLGLAPSPKKSHAAW